MTDTEVKDWQTLFKRAALVTEDDVKREIKTPAVLLAFERAKISRLPAEVLEACDAEEVKFDMYSQRTARPVLEGGLEGKLEIAKQLTLSGVDDLVVAKSTGLSVADLDKIRDTPT